MYFAVLFLLLILVFYLNNLCNKSEQGKKCKNRNINRSTLNLGWRITPYLKYKISSFESRIDLEKMRIIELIKNNLNIKEGNIEFIEERDNFYIRSKNEILYGKFILIDNEDAFFNKYENLKKEVDIRGELYKEIEGVLKKYLYLVEEKLFCNGEGVFKIGFSSGYIFLSLTKEESIELNKEKDFN